MKISMATYSLRDEIKEIGMEGIADFLDEIGLKYVEVNNVFTKPERLPKDAKLFRDRGIEPILLTVDGNNYFMPDEEDRQDQFEYMKKWLDAADAAGIKMVRANMGHAFPGIYPEDDIALADLVETFKPIQEYAESLGITHVFENHGRQSSDVKFQLKVKEHFPSEKMGYLLDTGNYDPKSDVYENIGKLGDSIKIVHAKTYDFDNQGEETQLDFNKIISELKKIGFNGFYSIEFEGELDPRTGVRNTLALLKKYL